MSDQENSADDETDAAILPYLLLLLLLLLFVFFSFPCFHPSELLVLVRLLGRAWAGVRAIA